MLSAEYMDETADREARYATTLSHLHRMLILTGLSSAMEHRRCFSHGEVFIREGGYYAGALEESCTLFS